MDAQYDFVSDTNMTAVQSLKQKSEREYVFNKSQTDLLLKKYLELSYIFRYIIKWQKNHTIE